MKTPSIFITLLLCTTLGACDHDTIDASDFDTEVSPAPALAQRAESELKFDTSEIERHPAAALPSQPLSARAFTAANLERSLLRSTEGLKESSRTDTRLHLESANWHAELDALGGQVLAVLKPELGTGTPPSERELQANAMRRLQDFGVPADEVASVVLRKAMSLDEQDGILAKEPELDGYKTFVTRGVNGVRVLGHRAVLTHGAQGTFRRVLMRWPALAAKGHKLRSPLSTGDIVARATRELVAEGLTRGEVKLKWMYTPIPSETGEVTLELRVLAALPASPDYGEGRAIEVVVDAG